MSEDWITSKEAAEISGYHVNYLRWLIKRGKIEAQKFGPIWQVSRASLISYLQTAENRQDKRWGPKSSD